MQWFQRKPIRMRAVQWLGDNLPDVEELVGGNFDTSFSVDNGELFIHTLEGRMHASVKDWIVCRIDGEFWAVKPHIFERTYEPVCDGQDN